MCDSVEEALRSGRKGERYDPSYHARPQDPCLHLQEQDDTQEAHRAQTDIDLREDHGDRVRGVVNNGTQESRR